MEFQRGFRGALKSYSEISEGFSMYQCLPRASTSFQEVYRFRTFKGVFWTVHEFKEGFRGVSEYFKKFPIVSGTFQKI